MVFYFTARSSKEEHTHIFMGRDKVENEDLIKYGLPEDIWFHVDKLSSAHVYVRLAKGQTIDAIEAETLEDCAQLCKANSIMGNKKDKLDIVYTPWANLKKTASMEVGQVGFFNDKEVKRIRVDTRCNEICNRLNKTKVEEYPDLALAREEYDKTCKRERQEAAREQKNRERMEQQERDNDKEARSYDRLLTDDAMESNKDLKKKYKSVQDYEDDFM